MTTLYMQKNILFASALVLCIGVLLPYTVSANYTLNGKTFQTKAELQNYYTEYLKVWRDVHGYPDISQSASSKPTYSTTQSKLSIQTKYARDLTKDGITFVGSIDFEKSKKARIWFEYGFSPNTLTMQTESEVLKKSGGSKLFDRKVAYLLPAKTYYYRAVGLNEQGVYDYGEVRSFTTAANPKSDLASVRVQTSGPSNVDENRATLKGTVDFKKATYTTVWFEHGTKETELYKRTPATTVYKENGKTIEYGIRELDSESTYFYRLVAEDTAGVRSYGKTVRFQTRKNIANEKPKAITQNPLNITLYSATLNGTVDMNDFRNGKVFYVYGENQSLIQEVGKVYTRYEKIRAYGDDRQKILLDADLDKDAVFAYAVPYLDINTKYYYAIGVEYENAEGDELLLMGGTKSFTTKKQ